MKKIFLKSLFLTVIFVGIFSFFGYVLAQAPTSSLDLGLEYGAQTGLGSQDIRLTIANIIRVALGLLGIVALVIVLWGGFIWMTAGGNEEKVATAKKILFNGIIGLVIILSSYAITSFIISRLVQATIGGYPDHCYNQEIDEGETGLNCGGGGCPACVLPFNPYGGGNYFKIKSVPLGGPLCVSNYHPIITFNYPVNLETVTGKIRILDIDSSTVEGAWTVTSGGQAIIFSATGDCGDGGVRDCFPANTSFTIDFTGANGYVESTESTGGKKLICQLTPGSTDYCLPIHFTTGEGVDRTPPTTTITGLSQASVGKGDNPIVYIDVDDDIAVQNVSLYVAGQIVGSRSYAGCQKSVSAEIVWPTARLQAGQQYTLVAEGRDQAAGLGTDSLVVTLWPQHCFDNVPDPGEIDVGPPACGPGVPPDPGCGTCPGGACTYDYQCGGGSRCIGGFCIRVMSILGISPTSGAPKNYMAIFGENFGKIPGSVYFGKVDSPDKDNVAHWASSTVVTCGKTTKNWFNDQIVVEVPEGFNTSASGSAIMVSGTSFVANTIGDGTDEYSRPLRFYFDPSKDKQPSLCRVDPSQFSSLQNNIEYIGKNFGDNASGDGKVYLNIPSDVDENLFMTIENWGPYKDLSQIKTQAPQVISDGSVTTYVVADGKESNTLRVRIKNTLDKTAPIVESISPREGAKGEYVTIQGSNFGKTPNRVRFYKKPVTSLTSNYFTGSLILADGCSATDVWSDKQIVVKIPKEQGDNGDIAPTINEDYAVIVFNSKGQSSVLRSDISFNLNNPTPNPGICKIDPPSGPVSLGINVYGENFGTSAADVKLYFWKNGAIVSSLTGRASSSADTVDSNGQHITGKVALESITGQMVVTRNTDQSNPLIFTVFDCTKNNNKCYLEDSTTQEDENKKCCRSGLEKGSCKPVTERCEGEILSTGYMWRFTTKTFPKSPQVIRQCENYVEGQPYPTPSPAPSTWLLDTHNNTCKDAVMTIGITTRLDATTVNNSNILVYKCTNGPSIGSTNVCQSLADDKYSYNISTGIFGDGSSDQELIKITPTAPTVGVWEQGYYQVILKRDILSDDSERPQNLKATLPCDGQIDELTNTAFCYVFGISEQQCVLAGVNVMPYYYWTGVLESPIKIRKNKRDMKEISTTPLVYEASGVASEKCIIMNTDGYDYAWESQRPGYASIPPESSADNPTTMVNSIKNTVDEILSPAVPANGLYIEATISTTTGNPKTGQGLLKIDLSDPQIVDWGPRCLTACPNSEIFVEFDKQMSSALLAGAFTLKKCLNPACTQISSVSISVPNYLRGTGDSIIGFTIPPTDGVLATNTYYQLKVASNTIFTAASAIESLPQGKPYARDFSWVFGTKDKICDVARVEVTPPVYDAFFIGERAIYRGNTFSAPDECSARGQRLDPYPYNWLWNSTYPDVATIATFTVKGDNPFCGSNCLKKGSSIASGTYDYNVPMCGNEQLEAGEDCEITGENRLCIDPFSEECNCSESCLLKNKTKTGGCNIDPQTKQTICTYCGDGEVNSEEDCDLKIIFTPPNPLVTSSSLNCSKECLHTGTPLSAKWCEDNYNKYHTEPTTVTDTLKFEAVCRNGVSQCGNSILEPSEECEGDTDCNKYCLTTPSILKGSSLSNTEPSICGDGKEAHGIEDPFCESINNFYNYKPDASTSPWVLAEAVGKHYDATSLKQTTNITGQARNTGKTGSAQFNLVCGAKSDEECNEPGRKPVSAFGATTYVYLYFIKEGVLYALAYPVPGKVVDYGVGTNSCCYPRPIVSSTYPENGAQDVCPNTQIKISFNGPININTLPGNLLIARENAGDTCASPTIDVSSDVILSYQNNLPWYKKIWTVTVNFFQKIFGFEKATATWCVGETEGTPTQVYNIVDGTFDVMIGLKNRLVGNNATYTVIMREGISDSRGVSIGKDKDNPDLPQKFTFTTWDKPDVCKIGSVDIEPSEMLFTKANISATATAIVKAEGNQQLIQTTTVYYWDYLWSKDQSNSFRINDQVTTNTTTVTSANQNGEGDAFVTVADNENKKVTNKSHITVFLCENPWPPFEVNEIKVWPFDDSSDNTDYFDFSYNPETTETGFIGSKNTKTPYSNFSSYYCADAGVIGKKDDLPYMKPIVTSTFEVDILKYYLLTNDKNADAIGIKIASNTSYLTLKGWLYYKFNSTDFNYLKIDGYDAAVDTTGNNIYIAALNYNGSTIFSNIYLFSLSAYANAETKNIFDQMLSNLKFNVNLESNYNRKSCALSSNWNDPDPKGFCNTDLDCLGVEGKSMCLNQKEKMQRNYQRIKDVEKIKLALESYKDSPGNKYPSITENTFLTDRAFSIWSNSWNELGSQLGSQLGGPLPVDPINKLAPAGTCLKGMSTSCISNVDCGPVPSATGLIGYWAGENNFEDSSGSSTRRNDGSGTGVNFTSGVGHGQSFDFPTGYEKITIKHQDDYNTDLNNFALSFWFKPTEQTPAVLFRKGGWSDTALNNTLGGFMIEYNKLSFAGTTPVANNGTIRFAIFPSSTDPLASKQYFAVDSSDPLTINKWHHVLVRYYNGSPDGYLYMVIDGVEKDIVKQGDSNARETNLYNNNAKKSAIKIGSNNEDIIVGEGLKGQIDEIYLYSTGGVGGGVAPYNQKFENICLLHDLKTGWSPEDRRFSFACGDKSMAYGYKRGDSGNNYEIRGTREIDGVALGSWDNAWNVFGFNISNFVLTTFCEQPIITSNVGVCGDEVLNVGENCDYKGKRYDGISCTVNEDGAYAGKISTWRCINCFESSFSEDCVDVAEYMNVSCGDGITQTNFGEKCDDGANNNRPGFCGADCQPQTNLCGNSNINLEELCDWHQSCSGGDEFCFIDNDLKVKWGLTKKDSCNSTCKNWGPYCGNGVWESKYEDCDGNQSCELTLANGTKIAGTKYCTSDCRVDNSKVNGLISFWNFNVKEVESSINYFNDSKNNNPALCGSTIVGSVCPAVVEGRNQRNNGVDFSKDNKAAVVVGDVVGENDKKLLQDQMSIELWIKPVVNSAKSAFRILEKGGYADDKKGGYGLEFSPFYNNPPVNTIRWAIWGNGSATLIDTPSGLNNFNIWHHIVVTYKKVSETSGFAQIYLDGNLENETPTVLMGGTDFPLCFGSQCVKKDGGGYDINTSANFKGLIDDAAFYNRVLTPAEIKAHYEENSWYCSTAETPEETVITKCGDGEFQPEKGETCDYGANNGVICQIPMGFSSCSWCTSDCKIRYNECSAGKVMVSGGGCCLPGGEWGDLGAGLRCIYLE